MSPPFPSLHPPPGLAAFPTVPGQSCSCLLWLGCEGARLAQGSHSSSFPCLPLGGRAVWGTPLSPHCCCCIWLSPALHSPVQGGRSSSKAPPTPWTVGKAVAMGDGGDRRRRKGMCLIMDGKTGMLTCFGVFKESQRLLECGFPPPVACREGGWEWGAATPAVWAAAPAPDFAQSWIHPSLTCNVWLHAHLAFARSQHTQLQTPFNFSASVFAEAFQVLHVLPG